MKTQHYIEFFWAGTIVANTSTREIEHRDPLLVVMPESSYGFRFFDRTVAETTDGETLLGPVKNGSKTYYPGGRIATADEIEAKGDPRDRILLSNMRGNGWDRVVYNRFGAWPQPYEPDKAEVIQALPEAA